MVFVIIWKYLRANLQKSLRSAFFFGKNIFEKNQGLGSKKNNYGQ